jgi:hypothetical protein
MATSGDLKSWFIGGLEYDRISGGKRIGANLEKGSDVECVNLKSFASSGGCTSSRFALKNALGNLKIVSATSRARFNIQQRIFLASFPICK